MFLQENLTIQISRTFYTEGKKAAAKTEKLLERRVLKGLLPVNRKCWVIGRPRASVAGLRSSTIGCGAFKYPEICFRGNLIRNRNRSRGGLGALNLKSQNLELSNLLENSSCQPAFQETGLNLYQTAVSGNLFICLPSIPCAAIRRCSL